MGFGGQHSNKVNKNAKNNFDPAFEWAFMPAKGTSGVASTAKTCAGFKIA
jgi:hypothetical protein